MTYSFTEKKRIRRDFGKRPAVIEEPYLLAIQTDSYKRFINPDGEQDGTGLQRAFEGAFEKSVVFWNPLENLEVKADRIDINALNHYASQLAVTVGLASRVRRW